MSLNKLFNAYLGEQPIDKSSTNTVFKKDTPDYIRVNNNIIQDNIEVVEDIEKEVLDFTNIQDELVKIKLLIPQSHYNVNGFHYSLKQGDIAEIPHDKANRLIAAGFALNVSKVKI